MALLKLKRETYQKNLNCNITIKAPLNYGIIAYIKKVKLRKSHNFEDFLQVTADKDANNSLSWLGTNEELLPKNNIASNPSKGEINVFFKSQNFTISLPSKGFKIIFTVFTRKNFNLLYFTIFYFILFCFIFKIFKISHFNLFYAILFVCIHLSVQKYA